MVERWCAAGHRQYYNIVYHRINIVDNDNYPSTPGYPTTFLPVRPPMFFFVRFAVAAETFGL